MHALDVLGVPTRRRILELLADGERSAGEVVAAIQREYGISQPAVSQHLRVLYESGFATVRAAGQRRLYSISPTGFLEVDDWLGRFRRTWETHLDALGVEIARGKRQLRRRRGARATEQGPDSTAAALGA